MVKANGRLHFFHPLNEGFAMACGLASSSISRHAFPLVRSAWFTGCWFQLYSLASCVNDMGLAPDIRRQRFRGDWLASLPLHVEPPVAVGLGRQQHLRAPRATEALTLQRVQHSLALFRLDQRSLLSPDRSGAATIEQFCGRPHPSTRTAASFNMLATWMSKRGIFALVGAVTLIILLAGHYTYKNSIGGMLCLSTQPTRN